MPINFEDFVKREHEKRVAHFVNFINAHTHKATIEDCIEVFGFVEEDARPIFTDAWQRVMH